MSASMRELWSKMLQAERDPWSFYDEHSLRDQQIACHPDRWPDQPDRAKELFARFQAAHDRASTRPVVLEGSKRHWPLMREIARGDLRVVHQSDRGHLVKVPRIKNKAANNLIAKEAEVLTRLHEIASSTQYAYYYPHLIETFVTDGSRINVTLYDRELFTAARVMQRYPDGLSGRHIGWMLKRILVALAFAHSDDWCHGAITPEHVMFCPKNHAGVLTGWIHAGKSGKPITVVPQSRKDWYPAEAKQGHSPSIDIAMAARLMQAMIHKDSSRLIHNFLKALRNLGSSAPLDAWEIVDAWSDLLKRVYGEPRFVKFEMGEE